MSLTLPYLGTNTYMSEKSTKPGELPDLQSSPFAKSSLQVTSQLSDLPLAKGTMFVLSESLPSSPCCTATVLNDIIRASWWIKDYRNVSKLRLDAKSIMSKMMRDLLPVDKIKLYIALLGRKNKRANKTLKLLLWNKTLFTAQYQLHYLHQLFQSSNFVNFLILTLYAAISRDFYLVLHLLIHPF